MSHWGRQLKDFVKKKCKGILTISYFDIGLNLFCRQFSEPERIIRDAEENGVCCILQERTQRKTKSWQII